MTQNVFMTETLGVEGKGRGGSPERGGREQSWNCTQELETSALLVVLPESSGVEEGKGRKQELVFFLSL